MGMLAGFTRQRWAERLLTSFAILGISIPHYWMGIVLVAVFSVKLGLFPAMGMGPATAIGEFGLNDLRFIILPALTLSLIPTAIIARTTRATIIETRKMISFRCCAASASAGAGSSCM